MKTINITRMPANFVPDISFDVATDRDLWIEEQEHKASEMGMYELLEARKEAKENDDPVLVEIYSNEIDKRNKEWAEALKQASTVDMAPINGDDPELLDAAYEAWETSWIDGPQ